MRISKSHLTSFALGSLVTGIVCYFLLSWTTNPQAAMPVVSKTPGSPASATPTSASTPGSPFAPSDIRTSAFQDQTALWIPAEVINLMFDESMNYHDLTIQPTWRAKLQLSQAQAQAVERILRQQVIKLGQVEAKTARLATKANGDMSYLLAPNPIAGQMKREFADELQNALGPDYPHADFLSTALAHSRVLSGFGSTPREVYVTDYTLQGKTSTVVEITEQVRLDPKNQSSRAYTVSPEREFVKLRYPFLK